MEQAVIIGSARKPSLQAFADYTLEVTTSSGGVTTAMLTYAD